MNFEPFRYTTENRRGERNPNTFYSKKQREESSIAAYRSGTRHSLFVRTLTYRLYAELNEETCYRWRVTANKTLAFN
jgi:hypothetical protein